MCFGKSVIAAQTSVHRWTPFWIWMQSATKMEADTPLFFFYNNTAYGQRPLWMAGSYFVQVGNLC
jgi:hypothetical protein